MPRYPLRRPSPNRPPVRLRLEPVEDRLAPAALDGRVWEDINADGAQDPGEPGLANVTVEVHGGTGVVPPPANSSTDPQGMFHFTLTPGANSLRVVPPAGYAFTKANVITADETSDSDVDANTGKASLKSDVVRLDAGLIRISAPGAPPLGLGYGVRLDKGQLAGPDGLAVDTAGNAIILGLTASPSTTAVPVVADPYVARHDPAGKILWRRDLTPGGTFPAATAVAADGSVYVLRNPVNVLPLADGQVSIPPGETPPELQKLSKDGQPVWSRPLGEAGLGMGTALAIDAAGDVFVGGSSGIADAPIGAARPWLAKLSGANGDAAWFGPVAGAQVGAVSAVVPDGAGGALFAGSSAPAGTNPPQTGFFGRADAAGKIGELSRLVGAAARPNSSAMVTGLARDAAGNVYLAGTFSGLVDFDPTSAVANRATKLPEDGGTWTDVFVVKLAPTGKPVWVRTVGGEFFDHLLSFERAADSNLYLLGSLSGTADFDPGAGTVERTGSDTPFLLGLDANGNFVRVATFDPDASPGSLSPMAVRTDASGSIYLAGGYQGNPDMDPSLGVKPLGGPQSGSFLARWTKATQTTPPPVTLPPVTPPPVTPPVTPPPVTGTNAPPTITALPAVTIAEGQTLILSATATDPNRDPLAIQWDLDGDGQHDDATGPTITRTWPQLQQYVGWTDSGPRTVGVRVSDNKNPPVTGTTQVTVNNSPPTAQFAPSGPTYEGGSAYVVFGKGTDAASADRAAGFKYSFDFNSDGKWDVGDGKTYAGAVARASAIVPAAPFLDSGPRLVKGRIFDKDGGSTEYTATVQVRNIGPRGAFAADSAVSEGSSAIVRFRGVTDPSPVDTRAGFRYSYDFNNDGVYEIGDGKTFAGSIGSSVARVPATALPDSGRYYVRARVFDRDGGYSEYRALVTVNNVAPTARVAVDGPALAGAPTAVIVRFVTDPGVKDQAAGYTYSFDFTADGQYDLTGREPRQTFTFAQPGTFPVKVRVADKDGGATELTLSVTVLPGPSV
ncbi:MAG TPA: SdrD B-like domain-containing protein [Gemmataceae bacterium]|nr:SdrD B-like domain-containing protein [Gemmataceae bacterium]